jgi:eukaryotic-like serine/threonine-protein kinase
MAFRPPTPGLLVDNKYRLAERIGGGGMGDVFRAEHVLAGRAVAIKFLHPELADNSELSHRFFQEAQAVNRIRHPNIVDVIDAGVGELGPYIVMEHLDGESLGMGLARFGRLDMDAAVGVAIPVLEALDAAHRAGIIHRDLKPENIFIAFDPGRGSAVVRLLDFGIAKILDSDGPSPRTRTGVVFGTPDYLSPEQATGDSPLDGRSDIFAVGVLLYEVLTGTRPFRAPTAVATAFRVVHAEVPTIASAGVTVDPRLEAIVQRCMQKDPAKRFPTAGDVVRELDRVTPDVARRTAALGRIINVPRRMALNMGQVPENDRDRLSSSRDRMRSGSSFDPGPPAPIRLPPPVVSSAGRSNEVQVVRPSSESTRPAPGATLSTALRNRGSDPGLLSPRESLPTVRSADFGLRPEPTVRSADFGALLNRPRESRRPSVAPVRPLPARFAGQYQVRGPVLRSVDRTLVDEYGKNARDEVVSQMPVRYADDFRHDSINALVGYDLEALDAYMELATSLVLRDLERWRDVGRLAVAGELHSLVRTLFARPLTDIASLMRRGISIWSRLFTFGSWRVATGPTGRVTLHIGDFDPASLPLRLWVVGMVEETARRASGGGVKVTITLGELGFTSELACEISL